LEGNGLNGYFGFVKKLIEGFEKERLDYAFTGALAASFYGVPRTTADVDVIVAASSKTAKTRLVSALRLAGLQVDEKRIDDAQLRVIE
jgi:Tfp pilus assembly PilM family ATPase